MPSYRRILVAIKDPTARMPPCVAKAAQLARACGAHLEIFHAITEPIYADWISRNTVPKTIEEPRRRFMGFLQAMARTLERKGLRVSVAVDTDFPAHEAIIRRAVRTEADLIVVDCHPGHRGAWLLLLTDWELLRHSPVPVLLVKSSRPYRRPVILAAVDPMHSFAKPSKLDAQVLGAGQDLAKATRGSLHAVHACYAVPTGSTPAEILNPQVAAELQLRAERAARKAFERETRKFGIARSRQHLVSRRPFEAIEQLSRSLHADILVMGAVSRSALRRLLIGNTAERVLDAVGCDVLVVKPKHFASRIPRTSRGARVVLAPTLYPHQ